MAPNEIRVRISYGSALGDMMTTMAKQFLTPEQGAELQRLYKDLAAITEKTASILAAKGMASPEFEDADKAATDIWRRIREIRGDAG